MPPFPNRLRAAAPLALFAFLVAACFGSEPFPARCFDLNGFPRGCIGFTTFPQENDYILKGDTVHMETFSDSGFRNATYTLTGDAIRFIVGGAQTTTITTPANNAVIRGIVKGQGTVTAQSASTAHSNTVTIRVADSVDITDIDFNMAGTTLRQGDSLAIFFQLKVASGDIVQGDPITYSTSSTAIAEVVEHTVTIFEVPFRVKYLRGVSPGTTRVRAQFLAAADSIAITVTP